MQVVVRGIPIWVDENTGALVLYSSEKSVGKVYETKESYADNTRKAQVVKRTHEGETFYAAVFTGLNPTNYLRVMSWRGLPAVTSDVSIVANNVTELEED